MWLAQVPVPAEWTSTKDPPYFYWTYYIAMNLKSLNAFRASRGLRCAPMRYCVITCLLFLMRAAAIAQRLLVPAARGRGG